jgi:hypothetical protein
VRFILIKPYNRNKYSIGLLYGNSCVRQRFVMQNNRQIFRFGRVGFTAPHRPGGVAATARDIHDAFSTVSTLNAFG